jgi:hypothetical protein
VLTRRKAFRANGLRKSEGNRGGANALAGRFKEVQTCCISHHSGRSYSAMKSAFQSFITGVGSVLCIFPPTKSFSAPRSDMEAIGADFAAVGRDIQFAIDVVSLRVKSRRPADSTHGNEPVQLPLI